MKVPTIIAEAKFKHRIHLYELIVMLRNKKTASVWMRFFYKVYRAS